MSSTDLKDLLEKSSSLLKRTEKLEMKPLERVLLESDSLLAKLNKDVVLSHGSGSASFSSVPGESLLVQEGFDITSYVSSLKELQLDRLSTSPLGLSSDSVSPMGGTGLPSSGMPDLPLRAFLEREETYLVLSCVEEVKTITSNLFYARVKTGQDLSWAKEKSRMRRRVLDLSSSNSATATASGSGSETSESVGVGGVGGVRPHTPSPEDIARIKAYSSVLHQFIQLNRLRLGLKHISLPEEQEDQEDQEDQTSSTSPTTTSSPQSTPQFSKWLRTYLTPAIGEAYQFVESLERGSLVTYLEKQFERHLIRVISTGASIENVGSVPELWDEKVWRFVMIRENERKKSLGTGTSIGAGLDMVPQSTEELEARFRLKWEWLYYVIRIGRLQSCIDFIRINFTEDAPDVVKRVLELVEWLESRTQEQVGQSQSQSRGGTTTGVIMDQDSATLMPPMCGIRSEELRHRVETFRGDETLFRRIVYGVLFFPTAEQKRSIDAEGYVEIGQVESLVKFDFSSVFKIEDYMWYKLRLGTARKVLRRRIVKSGPSHFRNNRLLYFKLLLLVGEWKQAMQYFRKAFPWDVLNYVHLYLGLYAARKVDVLETEQQEEEGERNARVTSTSRQDFGGRGLSVGRDGVIKVPKSDLVVLLKEFSEHLVHDYHQYKDAIVYLLYVQHIHVRISLLQSLFIHHLSVVVSTHQEFEELAQFLTHYFPSQTILSLFDAVHRKLTQMGKYLKALSLLFFMARFARVPEIETELHSPVLPGIYRTILVQLVHVLHISISNDEFDNNVVEFSQRMINASHSSQFQDVDLGAPSQFDTFTTLLKLYRFFFVHERTLISIKSLGLLPFDHEEISPMVNRYQTADHKIRDLYPRLLAIAFRALDIEEKQGRRVDNEKKLLILFKSQAQISLPTHLMS